MKILKETKTGWYVNTINWNCWGIAHGMIEPLSIIWSLGTYKLQNPKYVAITIFGFGVEIGKYER